MPSPLLDLDVQTTGTTRLLALAGELDLSTTGPARAAIAEAIGDGIETLVIDLAAVTFTGSCGLHLVQDAADHAAARGVRLVLLPGPPHVQAVFGLVGLLDTLPFARSGGRFARA